MPGRASAASVIASVNASVGPIVLSAASGPTMSQFGAV